MGEFVPQWDIFLLKVGDAGKEIRAKWHADLAGLFQAFAFRPAVHSVDKYFNARAVVVVSETAD